ncbi:MAG TPA: hypothetical protein VF655_00195 [Allosphingosinicella sp.]
MCGPAALAIAGAAMTIGGQITEGVGAARQAGYESKVAKINSGLESERARDAIVRGEEQVRIFQNKAGQERGAMRAAMAANGIDLDYGSASDVLGDQAQNAAEDAAALTHNSEREAMGFRQSAANWAGEAAAAKARKRGAIVGTVFKVGATALSSASQVGKINAAKKAG